MEYYIVENLKAVKDNAEQYKESEYYFRDNIDELFNPEYCIIRLDTNKSFGDVGGLMFLNPKNNIWEELNFIINSIGMFMAADLNDYIIVADKLNSAKKLFYVKK